MTHHDDCPTCTCDFDPPEWYDYIATATRNDDGVPAYEHCIAIMESYGYNPAVALQTAIAVNENFSRARCKYKKPWKVFLAWYVRAINQQTRTKVKGY